MEGAKASSTSILEDDPENAGIGENGTGLDPIIQDHGEVETALGRSISMSFTRSYRNPLNKPREYPTMQTQTLLLAYQSLGVVYGDLGTSPVNVFSSTRLINLREEDLLGTFSLIFWTLTLLVLIKYVFIVIHGRRLPSDDGMRYYNRASPLRSKTKEFLEASPTAHAFLIFVVLLGTCMVIGDGALTPATCVLSAVQGIQSCSSKITQDHVVLVSVVLLVALFLFQSCGTAKVSIFFSPIMLIWFVTNASIGIYNILKYNPSILKGVSPHYAVVFISRNAKTGWHLLGAVFLSITGAEAMFADLGHFNKRAIQLAFSFVVYPALILTYAGETAYLIKYPEKISNTYYGSIPGPVYWPVFIISILAAVVASQSMISASFSIIKQSLSLGCFPRVTVLHTSSKHQGQVYSPEINYTLMILCISLVIGFRGGIELTNAYGVVVIWVMIITTLMTTLIMMVIWNTNIILILAFFLSYTFIEGIFMASLLNKIPQGDWVPFAISAVFLTVMLSWSYGRSKKSMYEAERQMSLSELNQMLSSSNVYRTPGICFFFADLVNGIPPVIRHYIQHTNTVREIMVIVTVGTLPIKTVRPEERYNLGKLGPEGLYRCLIQLGYKDSLNMEGGDYIAAMVANLEGHAENIIEKEKINSAAESENIFVIGRTILKANQENGLFARFTIDYLYRFLQKNCRSSVSALQIPPEKMLQIGMLYEI